MNIVIIDNAVQHNYFLQNLNFVFMQVLHISTLSECH
jgi:hypothetical protein